MNSSFECDTTLFHTQGLTISVYHPFVTLLLPFVTLPPTLSSCRRQDLRHRAYVVGQARSKAVVLPSAG